MRFMTLYKPGKESDAPPTQKEMEDMGRLIGEMAQAGVLIATDGLQPSSKGARVKFSGDKRIVTDGPFAETKELVAGFWIWKCASMAEAIEWAKKCPNPHPGQESEIEIRPFFELEDFGGDFSPELHERFEKLQLQAEANQKK